MTKELANTRMVNDESLHEFIRFCKDKIGYAEKAKILISDDHSKAARVGGMGAFFPDLNVIWVLRGQRLRADWYRTLAHELVHHGQRQKGLELNGGDGSEHENEANSVAGVILREWGRTHKEIYLPEGTKLQLNESHETQPLGNHTEPD